jgi:hypothetical protein
MFNRDILHIVSDKLNTASMDFPGEDTANQDTGTTRFRGQKGGFISFDNKQALAFSDTSVGTLYGGVYQLVQVLLTATLAPAVGLLAYWNDYDDYVVTPDVPTQPGGTVAGVFINAITKGDWGFIQVAGRATVQVAAAVTEAVVIGDTAFAVDDTGGNVNNLADATAVTAGNLNDKIGRFLDAPLGGALGIVSLENIVINL